MRDKSKQLLVINTGKKESGQTGMPSQSGTTHIIGGGGLSVNMSDYLLKSIWDKVFEIRTDSQGIEYIFGKLPMVTQYGITMYSGDGVDIPSLASGLPFDGRTIWYNPDTQQIEVIGGTGGGSGEGVSNFWDLSGIPSWITNSKPKYTYSEIEGTPDLTKYALVSQIPSLSGYATESWVLQKNYATKATTLSGYGITDAYTKTNVDDLLKSYVTLGGRQTITGEKNFTGGLKVNGSPIYYDTEKKYWKLEGDLLVTGGVTMYGSDSSFTPSTIMDALLYDDTTLGINSEGELYVKGGTSGGGLDITALQNYLTQNSYLNVTGGDDRYLMLSGGTLKGKLTIKNSTREVLDIISTDIYGPLVKLCYYNNVALSSFGHIRKATESNLGAYWMNNESGCGIMLGSDGKTYIFTNKVVKAEHEIWHEGNFTPSNYLPLSGGTLSSNLTIQNKTVDVITLYRDDVNNSPSIKCTNKSDGTLGYIGVTGSGSSFGIQPFFMDSAGTVNKIWHSGNDGSGSGLDADLLDGIDSSLMFYARKGSITSNNVNTTLANGVYYTAAYTPISGVYSYGTFINFRSNAVGVNSRQTQFYIPDGGQSEQTNFGARIYFRDSWNSTDSIATSWHEIITDSRIKDYNAGSATKLQTARTIWGQSFDGTGNVDGALTINKATTSSGDYGACVLINGTYAETGFHRALSYENQKMALGSQAAVYIGAKNNQYNGGFIGFKYVASNSPSNYMSIGLYAANDLLCVLGNGNVGIGTTSPEAKAHILSSEFNILKVARSNAFGAGIYFSNSNGELGDIGFHDNKNFVIRNSAHDANLMELSQSGNLLVIGGMTMYSQRSLKNVVNERGLSLNELSTIKPTRYTWKDGRDNRLHFGGIADDIQQVLPEVVYSTSDGILTMDYGNAAFAVASSLIQPVVDHEKRIAMLEGENKELRNEIERLKSA